jgi:LmbE family N-acetylglucosaminyl deacetylase
MKVLVIAAHPDDEVLGVGGTMAKHAKNGDEVAVVVVSEGASSQYADPNMIQVRRDACKKACKLLGAKKTFFFDLPDAKLMESGIVEITNVISKVMSDFAPNVVYAPDKSELHMDHRMVYEGTLVVTRPYLSTFPKGTLCFYETSFLRFSPFTPSYYSDITDFIDTKIDAFSVYDSEIEDFPHPRSIESIKAVARMRGAESGVDYAEGFVLGRKVW